MHFCAARQSRTGLGRVTVNAMTYNESHELMHVLPAYVSGRGDHGQPQIQRFTLAGDTYAPLFMLATLAGPSFFAGVRYDRQRGDRKPR